MGIGARLSSRKALRPCTLLWTSADAATNPLVLTKIGTPAPCMAQTESQSWNLRYQNQTCHVGWVNKLKTKHGRTLSSRRRGTFAVHHWQCSWCREDEGLRRGSPRKMRPGGCELRNRKPKVRHGGIFEVGWQDASCSRVLASQNVSSSAGFKAQGGSPTAPRGDVGSVSLYAPKRPNRHRNSSCHPGEAYPWQRSSQRLGKCPRVALWGDLEPFLLTQINIEPERIPMEDEFPIERFWRVPC